MPPMYVDNYHLAPPAWPLASEFPAYLESPPSEHSNVKLMVFPLDLTPPALSPRPSNAQVL